MCMVARWSSLLILALGACAPVQVASEPTVVDPVQGYERLSERVRDLLRRGELDTALELLANLPVLPPPGEGDARATDLLRELHRMADEARIRIEFAKLDLQVKGVATMDSTIEVPFESRPRT